MKLSGALLGLLVLLPGCTWTCTPAQYTDWGPLYPGLYDALPPVPADAVATDDGLTWQADDLIHFMFGNGSTPDTRAVRPGPGWDLTFTSPDLEISVLTDDSGTVFAHGDFDQADLRSAVQDMVAVYGGRYVPGDVRFTAEACGLTGPEIT